jgi:hypothetical protein
MGKQRSQLNTVETTAIMVLLYTYNLTGDNWRVYTLARNISKVNSSNAYKREVSLGIKER